jgi:predicted tellurium resistance membrane protein TerC
LEPEPGSVEAFPSIIGLALLHLTDLDFGLLIETTRRTVMEFLSAPWWSALLAIILIDLVLAGDNAIVIALAARNLPHTCKKGHGLGHSGRDRGALGHDHRRGLAAEGPWPDAGRVVALIWIAYKLIADATAMMTAHGSPAATTFWGAMKTIVIADAIMGVDNVLGVAGAAHGSFDLVVIGLLISIPIVVFGSTLVLKLVERFPSIMYVGAGVLAFTAGKMIVNEKLLADVFKGPDTVHQLAYWAVCLTAILGVLAAGWLRNRRGSTGGPSGQAA